MRTWVTAETESHDWEVAQNEWDNSLWEALRCVETAIHREELGSKREKEMSQLKKKMNKPKKYSWMIQL